MPTAQLNLRLTPAQRAKINHNARFDGKTPTDYVRSLIDKEEKYVSGAEIYRRMMRRARAMRKAGLIPQ
jgi:uncharacterized protein (DUF1778 family)